MVAIKKGSSYTCRDLLRAVSMKGARLLTGDVGLETPVLSVNVMEVPDIADWTHPGEFLITTGYPFKDDEKRLYELLGALSRIGVAGLGIKLHRFIERISPEIVEYAKALRFPIIELGAQANFSDIVQEVTRNILESDMKNTMALQNQVEVLIDRFSQGESLENILSTLEELTGYAVLLTCPGFKPILGTKAGIILNGISPELIKKLETGGLEKIDVDGYVRKGKAYPIFWGDHFGGRLLLLEDVRSFQESDQFLIGQIKSLLSMELRNRMAMEELKLKYRNSFLQKLLSEKKTNETDVYLEAKSYGYPIHLNMDYVVALLAYTMGGHKPGEQELFRFSSRNCSQKDWMTAVIDGNLAIILPSSESVREQLKGLCREWPEIFEDNCVSFCLSTPHPVTELAKAYQEAVKIREISYRSGVANPFIEMEDLGIYAVLSLLPKSEIVSRFVKGQLSALKEYDDQHNSMLYTTLKVYLQKNCNAKVTAETLYTHYNTIVYRLDRIEQILNTSLNDVEVQFALRLALKLDAMQTAQVHMERRDS